MVENFCIVLDEIVDEDRQIGDALPQRRKINGHRVDAEEEVQTEGSVLDLGAQIGIGGGDEAGGDAAGLMAADADEGAVLEDLKQFGLNAQIEAADLVEEERSHVGLLHAAELGGHCARKCPFFIAKELGFKQGMRDGRTADLDERALSPHGKCVQQADADLFAGTTLTLNEDGNVCLCYALQLVSDRLHRSSLAKDNIQGREIEGRGGFSMVNQGHFFLSVSNKAATLQCCSHSTSITNRFGRRWKAGSFCDSGWRAFTQQP